MIGKLLVKRRRNPGWITRLCRWIRKKRREYELCSFYRSLGCSAKEAKDKAARTL